MSRLNFVPRSLKTLKIMLCDIVLQKCKATLVDKGLNARIQKVLSEGVSF